VRVAKANQLKSRRISGSLGFAGTRLTSGLPRTISRVEHRADRPAVNLSRPSSSAWYGGIFAARPHRTIFLRHRQGNSTPTLTRIPRISSQGARGARKLPAYHHRLASGHPGGLQRRASTTGAASRVAGRSTSCDGHGTLGRPWVHRPGGPTGSRTQNLDPRLRDACLLTLGSGH
jgi:hypothetical protein